MQDALCDFQGTAESWPLMSFLEQATSALSSLIACLTLAGLLEVTITASPFLHSSVSAQTLAKHSTAELQLCFIQHCLQRMICNVECRPETLDDICYNGRKHENWNKSLAGGQGSHRSRT